MADDAKTAVLGAEWDDALRTKLLKVLRKMGAERKDHTWGIGGSQEVETLEVVIEGRRIVVEAETYIGLSVTGPPYLVDRIQERLAIQEA